MIQNSICARIAFSIIFVSIGLLDIVFGSSIFDHNNDIHYNSDNELVIIYLINGYQTKNG